MSDVAGPARHFDLDWQQPLFPYQQEGVRRLLNDPQLLLADEMGLGKTIQVVAALRVLKHRGELGPVLVVAPAGLVRQWRRQFRDWAPELRLATVVGTSEERLLAWRTAADVALVGYESLRSDLSLKGAFAPKVRHWDIVVADEAQRLKNSLSEVSQALKRLNRTRTWALTGTPLENHLDDLLSLLDFVAPGGFDPRFKAAGLRRLLSKVQLRRRRREVLPDLPPKFVSNVSLELGSDQRKAYQRAETEGLVRLAKLGRELRITHVLELILRLKQICNFCPETGASIKLTDLRTRLDQVLSAGEKALVFTQFVNDPFGAHRLANELADFRPLSYVGALDADSRQATIDLFDNDPAHRVMVLSLKAGGVGLNLTSASHVFHFDRWWNPAVENQAEDRVHRIGQDRAVHVQAYTVVNTIEERIQSIIADKKALFADLVDGVDASGLRRLDLDELLGALRAS